MFLTRVGYEPHLHVREGAPGSGLSSCTEPPAGRLVPGQEAWCSTHSGEERRCCAPSAHGCGAALSSLKVGQRSHTSWGEVRSH